MKIDNLLLKVDSNIHLQPLQEEEVDVLFALVDANRPYLREFLGWVDYNTSRAHALAFIKEEKEKAKKLESFTVGIYLSNALVGVISLHAIDHLNQCASIGYWIAQKYQGKGIMSASVHAVIEYAFRELHLHRIELRCAVHNHKSRKIAERMGFSQEGTLIQAIHHYGTYFDAYMYGLTASTKES